jgi:hypothetical protein
MLRSLAGLTEDDLERQLLRRSVGNLAAGRHECADCGRTPLVGEHVHRYQRGDVVCELCRQSRGSEPVSSDLVRHSEHGQAVRLRTRLAA